jgi:drug/metabolite transporter (DMT)-like permease
MFHSSIWTLILGHFFFKTPVSRRSVGAAIVCVGGIVLVVGFDYGELKGNLLAVVSAVLYSVYSLVLRARATDNLDISMSMMFGFIGAHTQIPLLSLKSRFNTG